MLEDDEGQLEASRWRERMAGDSTIWSTTRPYAALDAIDEALEQALVAHTEREQRWQLNQLRGLLLTCRSGELGLEDCLRRLIMVLHTPMADR
jgi:hypothetical protein